VARPRIPEERVPIRKPQIGGPRESRFAGPLRYRYELGRAQPFDLAAPLPELPLDGLGRTDELCLSAHSLLDLRPLAGLSRLKRLHLRAPAVRDLSPLAELRGLKELTLVDVGAESLAPLSALVRLERLRLEGVPARDLRPLARLPRLVDLCLRRAKAVELTLIATLTSLRVLEITDGPSLPDLRPLGALTELRYLNLSGTRVLDADSIAHRASLQVDGLASAQPPEGTLQTSSLVEEWGEGLASEVVRRAEARLRWPCRLAGLTTRGGQRMSFRDNPWQLPVHLSVEDAIDRLWSGLSLRAPRFLGKLRSSVTAVALVAPLGDEAPVLAYVGSGGLMLGSPPRDPRRVEEDGFRLPLALRELYAVHATLTGEHAIVRGPSEVGPLSGVVRGRLPSFKRANRGLSPDRFRLLVDEDDGAEVLDLDALDGRGDPIVRRWYAETGEIAGRATIWDWFEDHAAELLMDQ
jgi:hypothetical protein